MLNLQFQFRVWPEPEMKKLDFDFDLNLNFLLRVWPEPHVGLTRTSYLNPKLSGQSDSVRAFSFNTCYLSFWLIGLSSPRSQNYLEDKLEHLLQTLKENTFSIEFANSIERMRLKFTISIPNNSTEIYSLINNEIQPTRQEEHWVPLSYIGNTSNTVGSYLHCKLKWKLTFTPGIKVFSMLSSLKDREKDHQAGIHSILNLFRWKHEIWWKKRRPWG